MAVRTAIRWCSFEERVVAEGVVEDGNLRAHRPRGVGVDRRCRGGGGAGAAAGRADVPTDVYVNGVMLMARELPMVMAINEALHIAMRGGSRT